jgi:hypothetical protein
MTKALVCFIATVWLATVVYVSWLTRSVLTDSSHFNGRTVQVIRGVSSLPKYIVRTYEQLLASWNEEPAGLLSKRIHELGCQNDFNFPCKADDGYLLLAGLNPKTRKGYVELIQISDGYSVKKWFPDWEKIINQLDPNRDDFLKISTVQPIAGHPLINGNGDLVFLCSGSIVTLPVGAGNNFRVNQVSAHHSIELSNDLKYYITPGFTSNVFGENWYLNKRLKCDSLMKISTDGMVVENKSFYRILDQNGLGGVVLGRAGERDVDEDLIHINQISIAPFDGEMWLKDDLLISARHLSEIYLYRPSENRITWRKSGRWKNQHSVQFISRNEIAVYDNNVFGFDPSRPKEYNFVSTNDINRVFVLRFSKGCVTESEPFKDLLEMSCVRPETVTQGRVRVLKDGGLFVEETNYGRHFRFSGTNIMWIRNNRYDEHRNGVLSWGRYFTKEEGLKLVDLVKDKN